MGTVTKRLAEEEITDGAIVSVIGAVDEVCISNMPKDDAKSDILTEFRQPFEFSGTGEVKDGTPHIHAVLGAEGNAALSGHLHWAKVGTHFVNVYVVPT
jgi:uncharacterized protein